MFLSLPPAPELSALVQGYWFVEDLPGEHEGRPIRTSPIPLAVLSVNIGRPNATQDGTLVPGASLLGLQSRVRSWRSWSGTYFVMAMLTVRGLVRLFPHIGVDSADRLLDLGAILGDAGARALASDVDADPRPRRIAVLLDRWLGCRLRSTLPVREAARIAAAHAALRGGATVEAVARDMRVDRRQLHRWFRRHLGVGPKGLAELERLHSSLRAVQSGDGDPVAGFSDQAHQIRHWRRRLDVTPGAYAVAARSPMADYFGADGGARGPAFYL